MMFSSLRCLSPPCSSTQSLCKQRIKHGEPCGTEGWRTAFVEANQDYLQCKIHSLEGALSLVEEAIDNALGELLLIVILVHLEDLVKRGLVHRVAEVGFSLHGRTGISHRVVRGISSFRTYCRRHIW